MTDNRWALLLGGGLAVVALSLLFMSWSRWGQSKLLAKCAAVAILAHIWLILYAYGTRLPSGSPMGSMHPGEAPYPIAVAPTIQWGDGTDVQNDSLPIDAVSSSSQESLAPLKLPASQTELAALKDNNRTLPPESPSQELPTPAPMELDEESILALADSLLAPPASPTPSVEVATLVPTDLDTPEAIESQSTQNITDDSSNLSIDPENPMDRNSTEAPSLVASELLTSQNETDGRNNSPSEPSDTVIQTDQRGSLQATRVPATYRMRFSPERSAFLTQQGGDDATEQAVKNGLSFLARSQLPNGSWPVAEGGAPIGGLAHSAMTGLAILAFLGAGHTHTDSGPYADTIRRGLDYLKSEQFPSGDLSGRTQIGQDPNVRFARMYSHAMAGLALSEAYAITGDATLLDSVRSAVSYTTQSMNSRTGGWRYDFATDDPGDTSQFGWQAMLLNSAHGSGAVPLRGQQRVLLQRFLDIVSTGTFGGLAVYRNTTPDRRPQASQATAPMTAEALAIRSMMDFPLSAQALGEAQRLLLAELPGKGEINFYYWYYATLALYQARGRLAVDQAHGRWVAPNDSQTANRVWEVWNNAMKSELLKSQVRSGPLTGSWDPNCVWGKYGGRTYSTALGCLCLEVYYRYLPVIEEPKMARGETSPPRPQGVSPIP